MLVDPNKPGYRDCRCVGIPADTLPQPDCLDSPYYKVPADAKGWISESGWENLQEIELDSRLSAIPDMCGVFVDPFAGLYVDLYKGFVDNGYGGLIEDDCYSPGDSRLKEGMMSPSPFLLGEGCAGDEVGGGGGGGGTPTSIPTSETTEPPPPVSESTNDDPYCTDPTLYLRLTFDGGGRVRCLGHVWSSGEVHEICPDYYHYNYWSNSVSSMQREYWRRAKVSTKDTVDIDRKLWAQLEYDSTITSIDYNIFTFRGNTNRFRVSPPDQSFTCRYYYQHTKDTIGSITPFSTCSGDTTKCCADPGKITDAMRNVTYTSSDGVTYTWWTGRGAWPN